MILGYENLGRKKIKTVKLHVDATVGNNCVIQVWSIPKVSRWLQIPKSSNYFDGRSQIQVDSASSVTASNTEGIPNLCHSALFWGY